MLAVAIKQDDASQNGSVAFFDTDGNWLKSVEVGSGPDNVVFTPDGTKVLAANEGEPVPTYTTDPEGSVSIIDLSQGVEMAMETKATFTKFNAEQNLYDISALNATIGIMEKLNANSLAHLVRMYMAVESQMDQAG